MFSANTILMVFLVFLLFDHSEALRGALFRTGRSIPFDRIPGTQSIRVRRVRPNRKQCQEVQLYVPCMFSHQRNCLIEKICVNEDVEDINNRNENALKSYQPRRNDFLRFGRSDPASPVDEVIYRNVRIPLFDTDQ